MSRISKSFFAVSICAAVCLTGCPKGEVELDDTGDPQDTEAQFTDSDGDGVTLEDGDCDDENAEVHPGRVEECNGLDDNCNEIIDEGFSDSDADGTADCQDEEECDGLDNDGDESVDEGFPDVDGDGLADCVSEEECDGIDNDGDGDIDEDFDLDQDGHTSCESDCDDNEATTNPDAEEIADDGVDNDCDGMVDETGWTEGDVQFVEIMTNPKQVSDPRGEWIELYNSTDAALVLNGLLLQSSGGTESHQIVSASPLSIEAGGFLVLGVNGDSSINGGVDVDYVYEGIGLANESDDLELVADGVVVTSLSWDDGASMPDREGASMTLDPVGYGAGVVALAEQWCPSVELWGAISDYGTPGESNELCSNWDHDGDGMSGDEGDCDDSDATIYDGAPEIDGSVDNDCDGDVEIMPVAAASYDTSLSTLEHCTQIYLDGSGSYDPDGESVSYVWELVSAPTSSATTSDDIFDVTDAAPVFQPDVEGSYTFTLTVTQDGAPSYPDSITLDVTLRTENETPVADAGEDVTASESVTCNYSNYAYTCDDCSDAEFSLDGSGSSDADGENLTYSWSTSSSALTFDDATSETPTVTYTGISTDYGTTNSETAEVSLEVTDCYGATSDSSDSVTLTFECTGS